MVWYPHLLKNFPQFIVIHTVKSFGIVRKAEVYIFLELSCFFYDPMNVGKFDLWFLCLFEIQLEYLDGLSSRTVKASLGEF